MIKASILTAQARPFFRLLATSCLLLPLTLRGDFALGSIVHEFAKNRTEGSFPKGGLVRDASGNFYGTTSEGGSHDKGTVFRLSSSGAVTVLWSFTGDSDGESPRNGVRFGPDGALYGTSSLFSSSSRMTNIFRVTTSGSLTNLRAFPGLGFHGVVILDPATGNLYGIASDTIFKIAPNLDVTSVYEFRFPESGPTSLLLSSDGDFYGATSGGGADEVGTVFRLSSSGTLTSIYGFPGGEYGTNTGASRAIHSTEDRDGNLYGTTASGGQHDKGSVFRLSKSGVRTLLHSFSGPDGQSPNAPLTQGVDGNFYGTTEFGGSRGAASRSLDSGTLFKITPQGALTFTSAYYLGDNVTSFDPMTGSTTSGRRQNYVGDFPSGPLLQDAADSSFYGTALYSAATNQGTVFRMPLSSVGLSASAKMREDTGTVSLAQASSQATTINLEYAGTAQLNSDYSASANTLVIPAGTTSASVTLSPMDDGTFEGDEVAIVTISGIDNGHAAVGASIPVTLQENDPAPTVSLSTDKASISEADEKAKITATLSFASPLDTRIAFSLAGSARRNEYEVFGVFPSSNQKNNDITIPAGEISGSFEVGTIEDSIYESDETIIVRLNSVFNATPGTPASATVTIKDNDAAPSVSLSTSGTLREADGSATITASQSRVTEADTTIELDFTGTAENGKDYMATTARIMIPAGMLSGSTIIKILDDRLYERNKVLVATIKSLGNAVKGTPDSIRVGILDDDPPPKVSLAYSPTQVSEAGEIATVTARLDAVSGVDARIALAWSGGAKNGNDYTVPASTITIPAGSLQGTVAVTTRDDDLYEKDETLIVGIESLADAAAGSPDSATALIQDNDPLPKVSLAYSPSQISEAGGVATVTARLDVISALDAKVELAWSGTAENAKDYAASSSTIIIPAGSLQGTAMAIARDDDLHEKDETLIVGIQSLVDAAAGSPVSATTVVTDNDAAPAVSLSIAPSSFAESGGSSTITATLAKVSGLSTTVEFGFSGTAEASRDYTATAASLVIPAGSLQASIALNGLDDTQVEGEESAIVRIKATDASIGSPAEVIAGILDNDVVTGGGSSSGGSTGGGSTSGGSTSGTPPSSGNNGGAGSSGGGGFGGWLSGMFLLLAFYRRRQLR